MAHDDLIRPVQKGAADARERPGLPAEDPFEDDPFTDQPFETATKAADSETPHTDPFEDSEIDMPFEGSDVGEIDVPSKGSDVGQIDPSPDADTGRDPFADDPFESAAGAKVEVPQPSDLGVDPFAEDDPQPAVSDPFADDDPVEEVAKAKKRAKRAKRAKEADPFADDPFEAEGADALPTPEPSDLGTDPFAEVEAEVLPEADAEAASPETSDAGGAPAEPAAEVPKTRPKARSKRESTRIPAAAARAMRAEVSAKRESSRARKAAAAPVNEDGAEAKQAPAGGSKAEGQAKAEDAGEAAPPKRKKKERSKTGRMDAVEDAPRVTAKPRTKTRRMDPIKADGPTGRPKVVLPPPAPRADTGDGTSRADSLSREDDPPLPTQRPVAIVAAVCLLGVVLFAFGGLRYLDAQHMADRKSDFLKVASTDDPETAILAFDRLPEQLRADPEVEVAIGKLRAAVAREAARTEASDILRELPHVPDDAARLALCDRALEAYPASAEAYVERARLKARLALQQATPGESQFEALEEALADLHTAVKAEPEFAEGHLQRGLLFLSLTQHQAALTDLEKAVELGGRTAVAALARAHLALTKSDPQTARKQFERAIRKARKPALKNAGRLGLARAALLLGDPKAAWDAAVEARKRDPQASQAHMLLAEARQGREPDRAASLLDLTRAIELDPWSARAKSLKASLLLDRGPAGELRGDPTDLTEAGRLAHEALAADEGQALSALTLAELALHAGKLAEAIKHATSARTLARGTDRVEALVLVVRLHLLESGSLDSESVAALDEALKIEPLHVVGLSLRAQVRADAGDREGALDDLDQSLVRDPALPDAYALRARLNMDSKPVPLRKVIDDLTRTLQLDPQRKDVYLTRARAQRQAGRLREALADLRKAEGDRATPKHAIALVRGDCHYDHGAWKSARQAYTTYLRLQPQAPDREEIQTRIATCDRHASGASADF